MVTTFIFEIECTESRVSAKETQESLRCFRPDHLIAIMLPRKKWGPGIMFRKILIANRGELVERVRRTATEMGIESVVVYSTADKNASYVQDSPGVCIGPARSSESYLDAEAIVQAARQNGCSAIHPGWGFLSEKATFAALCEQHGVTFIGPPPEILDLMGQKTPAKKRMAELGVHGVPGSDGLLESAEDALKVAREIGFPIMLKAESGGGGRGMRICREESEVLDAAAEASREAAAAFADPRLYLEKYIESGRHIEVQVLVDRFGQAVTLGERECSVQRKHQKLIEEAPSPALDAQSRADIEALVSAACSALGYRGAGTVEFLRAPSGELYFIEMNTRLQVEHTISEMITGVDLVAEQLKVAAGHAISPDLGQERSGHAIECRINAEDPDFDFKPSPGTITKLVWPEGPGVRIDSHVFEGYQIPPYYDSLLAKVIVHADTRDQAIDKMITALSTLTVEGVKTTKEFQKTILQSEAFRSGNYDTRIVETLNN
jgi:acetyl-CoA carboxylase, biotin carboxylase subunit